MPADFRLTLRRSKSVCADAVFLLLSRQGEETALTMARARNSLAVLSIRVSLALAVFAQALLWSHHFTIGAAHAGADMPGGVTVICTARGLVLIDNAGLPLPGPTDPAADEVCGICAAFTGVNSLSSPCEAAKSSQRSATAVASAFPQPIRAGVRPASLKSRGPPA
jgi:hypothetical protein